MSDNKQTAATNYRCEVQQRGYAVQMALAGHELNGLSLMELVNALSARAGKDPKSQKNNIFRDLHNLKEAGLAEQLPDSARWRLGPKAMQMALNHLRYMERAAAALDETRQRYSREPN